MVSDIKMPEEDGYALIRKVRDPPELVNGTRLRATRLMTNSATKPRHFFIRSAFVGTEALPSCLAALLARVTFPMPLNT